MAKTNWQTGDTVLPDDLNRLGQEINDNAEGIASHKSAAVLDHPDGSVTTEKLADGAVTAVKVAADVAKTADLAEHVNAANGVHGATSAATANRIVQRDSAGRAKVAAPAAADDIARKDTVDAVQTNLSSHKSASILDHPDGSVTTAKLADGAVTAAKVSSEIAKTTDLTTHVNATSGVHGATSAATANRIVQRDSSGRFKAAAPAASDDVARKAETDAAMTAASNAQATANAALPKSGGTVTGDLVVNGALRTRNAQNSLYIGDDAIIEDINVANTIRIKGQQNAAQGQIYVSTNNWKVWHDGNVPADRTRKITISTNAPSGGANGDIWIQY